jgi:DNA/RNA-binding domain of Phe-tRNA-synthetase-like protein
VIFADEQGHVLARRWCWRQSEASAAGKQTRDALVTTEAHHANAAGDISAALADLLDLLRTYAGGEFSSATLDAGQSGF